MNLWDSINSNSANSNFAKYEKANGTQGYDGNIQTDRITDRQTIKQTDKELLHNKHSQTFLVTQQVR